FQNRSRSTRAAGASLNPSSPSAPVGYKDEPIVYTNGPTFPVSFFMLRLHLNSSFTTEEKILHLGLCLPHICTEDDVKKIVEETSKPSKKITVRVEAVRSSHNKYNIWADKTFLVLCVTTVFVIFLLIAGTCFDYYLEYLKKCKLKAKNCMFSSKIDMSMPDSKTKNGKCGLYVVNNNNNNNNEISTNCNIKDEHVHNTLELKTGNSCNASRYREPLISMYDSSFFIII
ncbi:unnamed protein product, partial [Callosobruchus maculatus]